MTRHRKPKMPAVRRIEEMTWGEMCQHADAGRLTWIEIKVELHRRVLERFGGVDPYGHLKPFDPREHYGRPLGRGDDET